MLWDQLERVTLMTWSSYGSFDLKGCFSPHSALHWRRKLAIMPVDAHWLCLPAFHIRPSVQTVRMMRSCPCCCWFPGGLPLVPEPPCMPAALPAGSHGAPPPPPFHTTPPSASQASSSPDPKLCLLPPTSDGRQEENVQPGLVSLQAFFWLWRLKIDFKIFCVYLVAAIPIILWC